MKNMTGPVLSGDIMGTPLGFLGGYWVSWGVMDRAAGTSDTAACCDRTSRTAGN